MQKAVHKEGREFTATERATMKTIADSNPNLMLDDPAIHGDRPIECECGHETVGEHNFAVTRLSVDHGVPVR